MSTGGLVARTSSTTSGCNSAHALWSRCTCLQRPPLPERESGHAVCKRLTAYVHHLKLSLMHHDLVSASALIASNGAHNQDNGHPLHQGHLLRTMHE